MVEIDPDYEDFYECQGPLNKAVSFTCFCIGSIDAIQCMHLIHLRSVKLIQAF